LKLNFENEKRSQRGYERKAHVAAAAYFTSFLPSNVENFSINPSALLNDFPVYLKEKSDTIMITSAFDFVALLGKFVGFLANCAICVAGGICNLYWNENLSIAFLQYKRCNNYNSKWELVKDWCHICIGLWCYFSGWQVVRQTWQLEWKILLSEGLLSLCAVGWLVLSVVARSLLFYFTKSWNRHYRS